MFISDSPLLWLLLSGLCRCSRAQISAVGSLYVTDYIYFQSQQALHSFVVQAWFQLMLEIFISNKINDVCFHSIVGWWWPDKADHSINSPRLPLHTRPPRLPGLSPSLQILQPSTPWTPHIRCKQSSTSPSAACLTVSSNFLPRRRPTSQSLRHFPPAYLTISSTLTSLSSCIPGLACSLHCHRRPRGRSTCRCW